MLVSGDVVSVDQAKRTLCNRNISRVECKMKMLQTFVP